METIVKQGNTIEWRNKSLEYLRANKMDDNMVHVEFTDIVVCFLANDTTINDVLCTSSDEIIEQLNGN
jgi:hypothetical protein